MLQMITKLDKADKDNIRLIDSPLNILRIF